MKKTFLISAVVFAAFNSIMLMAQDKITQTAGHSVLGEFAPKFAELNDDILFGDAVWNDQTLFLQT